MNRYSMTMDYVPSTNEYKVQYLYWKGTTWWYRTTGIGMKLLTIGHKNIWRSIEIPFSDFHQVITTMETFDGMSYILYSCSLGKAKMLRFQFEDESFMEVLTPKGMPQVTNVTKLKFLTWDKKISIGLLVKETFYVIWILVDSKKSKWEERRIVFPSNFLVHHHDMFEKFDPYYVEGCWLFLLRDNRKKCLPYNIETKTAAKVTNSRDVRDSIVRLEGMQ
ncbi:hypothetical protein Leryth_013826 [Lithospermum erythrorhizon]|nr:hypothetical protein Leryth_013826 [Lithospermum erythrorhizon]